MREGAKKRLIGAVVIVALAVIFVPMLFEPEPLDRLPPIEQSIPRPPAFQPGVRTETFLGPGDSGVGGGADPSAPRLSQPLALPPPAEAEPPVPVGEPAAPVVSRPPAAASKPQQAAPPEGDGKSGAASGAAPAARSGAGTAASWVVQVASVPSPAGASALEGKLKASGYPAFVEKAEVNGRVTYRVTIGPETDRARAEQTAARLREKHKVQPIIRNYP